MRRLSLLILLGAMALMGLAQTKTMYLPVYGNSSKSVPTPIQFNISNELLLVHTNDTSEAGAIANLFAQQNLQIASNHITDLGNKKAFLCPLPQSSNVNVLQVVASLSQETSVASVNYFLYQNNPQELSAPMHELFFRVKATADQNQVQYLLRDYGATLLSMRKNGTEKHSIAKEHDPVDVCTALYESGLFEFCEPNRKNIGGFDAGNYTDDQWYINAVGSSADTKVDEAWGIPGAKHGEGIKVAVIDEGIQYGHADFYSTWTNGYDAIPESEGVPRDGPEGAIQDDVNASHGTSVAGIIAAANNGEGITGVAYGAKVMPIRISYTKWWLSGGTWTHDHIWEDEWAADGIEGAKDKNAHIINCSWNSHFPSTVINEAITEVVTNGRAGLGIPVLFSSGNDYGSSVGNSSNHPLVICVGASKKNDSRADFSNYGPNLDVVAPGVSMATTDITGFNNAFDWDDDGVFEEDQGYNGTGTFEGDFADKDFTNKFSGTSAACPFAAGVMALILSNNPGLTEESAREILETTCYKVPSYSFAENLAHPNGTWNNQMGYGRVDALAAVTRAIELGGGDVLGSGDVGKLILNNLWIHNNVCYDPSNPPYIKWDAEAYNPFTVGSDRYIGNGIDESSPLLTTDIHGFGFGTYVVPIGFGKFGGTNTADITLYEPFFDVISPTFPVSTDMQLQLSTDDPVEVDHIYLLHDFTVELRGIKIVLDAEEASICFGETYSVGYHVSGTGTPEFSWQRKVGDGWENITFPQDYPIGGVQTLVSSEYEPGENMYRIRAENEEGCIVKSDTFMLHVSAPTINELDFDACLGSMEVPLDLDITDGVEPYVVSWSPGTYLSDPSAETPIFDPTTAVSTDYTVTVTDAWGCTDEGTAHVEVHPYGTLHVWPSAEPDVICFGGDSRLTSTGAFGLGPPKTWTWMHSDGTILETGGSNRGYDVLNLEETTTFTRIAIDDHNCLVSADVTITVDPSLNPVLSLYADPGTYCYGEPVDVTSTVTGGMPPYSYLWNTGETTPVIGATGELASLVVTDDMDCKSNEESVTISRLPPIAIVQVQHDAPGDPPQPWGTPYTVGSEDHTPAEITLCPGDVVNTLDHFNFYNGAFMDGTGPYTQEFTMTYTYFLPYLGDTPYEHTVVLGTSFPTVMAPDDPVDLGLPSGAKVTEAWLRIRITDAAGCVFPPLYEAPANFIHFRWPLQDVHANFTVSTSVCDQLYGIEACIQFDSENPLSNGSGDFTRIKVYPGPDVEYFSNYFYSTNSLIDEHCFTFHEAGEYTIVAIVSTDCGSDTVAQTLFLDSAWPVYLDKVICDHGPRRGELDSMSSHYARYTLQTGTAVECLLVHDDPHLVRYIAGRSVTLKEGFEVKANSPFLAKIDECLFDAPVSNKTLEQEATSGGPATMQSDVFEWNIYPNPTQGPFLLRAGAADSEKQIRILNAMGATVHKQNLPKGTAYSIEMNHLPAGVYFVQLTVDNLTQTKRLVIL